MDWLKPSRLKCKWFLGAAAALTMVVSPALAENMTPVIITHPPVVAPSAPAPEARGLESAVQAPATAAPTQSARPPRGTRGNRLASLPPVALSSHPYYIEFRSRHALSYGHTFLAYGRLGPGGKILSQTIAGLHPKGDDPMPWSVGHVIPVPSETGPSDGDLEEEYISARYRIDLTPAQYANVVSFVKKLQASSPLWHAIFYNCNAFVGDVAKHMGLTHPKSLEFPPDFINGINTMNGGIRTIDTLNERNVATAQ